MRNLPCLGVASGNGLGGIGGKAAATAAMEAADATTAPQPPHSTSSYFTTTYYHLTDDECMFLVSSQIFQSTFIFNSYLLIADVKLSSIKMLLKKKKNNYIFEMRPPGKTVFSINFNFAIRADEL